MKKILLIEDDLFLIDIYRTKLKSCGFNVIFVSNKDVALEKIKKEKIDLVLLDIVLPEADGWEVLKNIKQISRPPKVIILSNLGQKEEVEKGLNMGAEKYLIKASYTPSEVVEEIKKIL